MKKFLSIILSILMVVTMLPMSVLPAFAATEAAEVTANAFITYSSGVTQYVKHNNYLYKVAYTNLKIESVDIDISSYEDLRIYGTTNRYCALLLAYQGSNAKSSNLPTSPGKSVSFYTADTYASNEKKPVVTVTCMAVNEPVWSWSDSSATAAFTSTDGGATMTVDAAIEISEKTAENCLETDTTAYTATATANGKEYTNVKTIYGEQGPHNFEYIESGDYMIGSCTNGCGMTCTHNWTDKNDYLCDNCGFECHHESYTDGFCTVCGFECAHENQTGSVCEICGEHICSYNNGFCTECDAYEPATLVTNENYESFYLKADYVGYYAISNAGQLFWYANYINTVDRTANAVLTSDIDLENRPWTPIGSTGENSNNFRGIFDGQNYIIRGLYVEGDRAGLGFFGEVRTGTVKNFTIYGEVVVNTEVDYVGGVVGSICGVNGENDLERNGAIIQNIKSFVNLTVKAHGVGKIGGFVGYANHQSLIEQCSWYGTFDAGEYRVDNGAGGFIGRIQENSSEVTIRNCGAYGTIKTNYAGDYNDTATIYMGGFLSFSNTNAKTTIENCLFAGRFKRGENLTDEAFLGAFGTLRSVNAIKNCYYLGDDGLEAVHSDSNLKPGSDNVEITKATGEELKKGTVAKKLGEYWEQGVHYPTLKDHAAHWGSETYGYTDNGDGTHDMVCTGCDYVVVYNEAHTPADNATYTDNNDGTHSFTCGDCGATVSDNHDFGSGNTCICGAEIAFTGIVVDDENSDEYRYDETRKTYTIIIPADEVGGNGYLSYDIIGTNLTLIEDTNTLLKVQHENEDGLTSAPDDLLVDVLQDNGYFGWSVLGYGDGEWEKLLYSNDGGMTWTTYTFEVKQAYSITVNASQNGTVTANEYAIEGDNIALNVSPAEGYMLDTLSVTDASGNSVDVENNAFTMPASAVTVTATFAVCDHKDGRHETATDNGDGTHDATYSCCGAIVAEVPHTLDITTGKCSACGADMTAIATVTDSTNTYYAADAATLNQAVTAILETGSRTFTVELPADTEAEMITAIRRAICDTDGVADGSINLTLKGVTSIPGTTNWDGVAFGPGDIYDEAGEIVDQELVTQLASVNLPDATEIGAQAFYFCENLVAVSAPKAQTIGAQAFGYTALTSVEFPELTTIPTDMFSGTWTLSSAKFPKVTTIEQNGLLIGAKFNPENNPTPFPLELTAEGDITFNGSYHFNIASQNYSGKVDLVLCCDKKDAVTFHDDGTATWQVRDDLSYTFKSITFTCTDGTTNHSYTYTDNGDGTHDMVCTECGYVAVNETHSGGTATCTEQAKCQHCGASYGEVDADGHDWSNLDGVCTNGCGTECPHDNYTNSVCDKCGYECEHEWDKGVLTRPVHDAVLGSKDGYYTYTCTVCGEEKTEAVKSADYSAYEAVSEEINALLQSDELTNAAKQEIYSAANECGHLSNDLTESEQNIVDDLVAELEKIIADADEKIASGEYVKIDGMKEYNKIADALDAELMENYSQEEIAALAEKAGDEINARFGEIIEKAEALTGTVAENKDALAEIESEMRALYGEIKNCLDGVHNGLVYEVTEEAKCEVNAIESATCTLCGETDEREIEGTALEHEPNEQMCKGYWCSRCRSFYGEGNPDIHLDGYSSTGKIKDGQCDGCNKQLAFIKSGETYEINSYAHVVEFAPVVDGRYILTVDGPEGTEIDVREVVDGVNKGINCEVISDLVYVVDCTVGKIYRFEASNYYGYNISSMTLECETHKGTVQTCYGYICDACGEYFGEVPGHDIIIDEAVPPTCTQTGLTEGQHCSRCDDMTIIQEKVPATNHKDTLVKVDAKAATCTEAGWEAYEYCTACDYTTYEEIPALKHSFTKYEVTEEAECGKAGKEVAYCDHGCQTTDEREIPALKHSFTKYEVAEEAECGKTGKEVAYCDHGCGATDENEIPALKHEPLAAVVENEVAAECEKAGSYDLVVYCNLCGEELDRDTTTVAATGHADNDGDYKCDYGCGHEFEKPVDPTPDTPNTPDEPTDDTCDHICHSNNALMKFLWKIISFFYRLFNIQQYCDCGVIHYDTPVFG